MLPTLRRAFWRTFRPTVTSQLGGAVTSLSAEREWYYHIDFGYGVSVRPELRSDPNTGLRNWDAFLSPNLPDLTGMRVLDIGCNAGLYDLAAADAGATEVIGIDSNVSQAEFVKSWFGKMRCRDYSCVQFISADAADYRIADLGRFDLACLFCVIYHLGDAAHHVMGQLAQTVQTVALQGNTPRLTGQKYRNRPHQYLAGVPGMTEILMQHGFCNISVIAPDGHPKPLVIGTR